MWYILPRVFNQFISVMPYHPHNIIILKVMLAFLVFWVICLSCASLPPTKFASGLHGSFVFQTYKKLPPAVKLPALVKMRAQLKKDVIPAMPQKPKGKSDTSTPPSGKKQ